MSHIQKMIAKFCPEGVKLKALSDVGEFVRGNGLQKSDLVDIGVPAIHYGQVHTHYGVWAEVTKSFIDPALATKLRRAKPGDLVIATTSEDDAAVGKATAWLGQNEAAVSGDAYIYRHSLDPRFVSYFFQSEKFQEQKARHITGTKVRRISGTALAQIRIPVPPLEVQREIVRVLDHFTELAAELEAELEARSRQYAHYRSIMLQRVISDRVSLASLGTWQGGITPSKSDPRYWVNGEIRWLASLDISDESTDKIRGRVTEAALLETSLKVVHAPSVAVVMRSNILRRRLPIGLIKVDTTLNQDLRALVPREGVDAGYVYQVLRADSEDIRSRCVRTDGSMAAVSSQDFFKWEIPLPSLNEQRRIAARLGSFDALVNDLNSGLPAELAARRQQYEYYRDKLLTFKEAGA